MTEHTKILFVTITDYLTIIFATNILDAKLFVIWKINYSIN
jgi:hypothetical protein